MEQFLLINSVLLWIVTIFNLLLNLALIRKMNSAPLFSDVSQPNILAEGTQAPDFTVQALNGSEVKRSDFMNKEIAMVFVSSNCEPCRDKMPELQEFYPKAQRAGVELVIFNLEDINTTQKYVEELQFRAPVFAAPRGVNPLNDAYKVPGTPSYYIVDREGKIRSGGFFDSSWQRIVSTW